MKIQATLVLAALSVLPLAAQARQDRPAQAEKKLYCWNENGRKVCGDALPADAVDAARTELSASSGRPLARLGEQLTPEQRAAAEEAEHQARIAANAEAARLRRELAMAGSYDTEEDLRRAFDDRIVLVDEGLKTSRMGVTNLRQSLVSLLRQANDLELQGKPVGKTLAGNIRAQHVDLLRQQAIMRQQQEERASLDAELEHAVERYHALRTPGRR
ncbi:hypothetical protein [Luteimonas sp. SDU82]|uniref:hypothetical protein n=1 Tax=Luteimonas sp. SDU82 TaxID=3422592 RepID=UPI003EBCDE11